MKQVVSLAALLTAVAMLAGCGCCGGGDKKPKKMHHKKDHKSKHVVKNSDKKKASKPRSEYQKFCTKCDALLKDCKCYL